jgi:hypothetical protein
MSNFNSISGNLPSFINTGIQIAKSAAPSDVMPAAQPAASIQTAENLLVNSAKSLYEFFMNTQSVKMTGQDMSLILKDFLGMQKDINEFLANSSLNQLTENLTKSDLAKLLLSSQFDLGKLSEFMQKNGKEALSKLFTMTANMAQSGAVARSSQISEIIAVLNACTPNADTSQVQVLKNMMLLYLPWLPLGEQNSFSLEIGGGGNSEREDAEDSITVLIKTVNFGNVSVLIFKNESFGINFNIKASSDFPKDEVREKIKQEAKDYNVQTELVYEEVVITKGKNVSTETEVNVNTGIKINPFLILMAQTIIKVIIETDKNFSLVENRKEKL